MLNASTSRIYNSVTVFQLNQEARRSFRAKKKKLKCIIKYNDDQFPCSAISNFQLYVKLISLTCQKQVHWLRSPLTYGHDEIPPRTRKNMFNHTKANMETKLFLRVLSCTLLCFKLKLCTLYKSTDTALWVIKKQMQPNEYTHLHRATSFIPKKVHMTIQVS